MGKNSEAVMEGVVLDDLRLAAVRDGELNPAMFDTWIRNHERALAEFPGIAAKVGDRREALRSVLDRMAALDAREKAIADSALVRRLDALARGGDPQSLILMAARDGKVMSHLISTIQPKGAPFDSPAMTSLRRAVWDHALEHGPEFVAQHQASLTQVLSEQHLKNLALVFDAQMMLSRVAPPFGKPISPNPIADLEQRLGFGVKTTMSRMAHVRAGRTSGPIEGVDLFQRFLLGRSVAESDRLMKLAIYEPDFALALTGTIRGAPGARRRLNTWLFNVGLTPLTEDDQPPAQRQRGAVVQPVIGGGGNAFQR